MIKRQPLKSIKNSYIFLAFFAFILYCKDMRKILLVVLCFLNVFSAPLAAESSCSKNVTKTCPPKKVSIKEPEATTPAPNPLPPKSKSANADNWSDATTEKADYWQFDDESIEALNTSLLAWGLAFFVGIFLAAGLTNGPSPTNTPDIKTTTTTTTQ
ncbi:MAG: hypothetical protein ACOYL1_06555 [Chlamydiia bacterium]